MNAYDPFDPDFLDVPWSAYAQLRDRDPVHHHPATRHAPGFWALSRFDDIWESVRRPELFSSAQGLTFHPDEIGQLGLAPTIVMLDPPRHTQLRALIGRGFTPKRVTMMEAQIREFARGLVTGMR
ncbi:MAG: cytochrome P450, partial [Myxococcales bacterium]